MQDSTTQPAEKQVSDVRKALSTVGAVLSEVMGEKNGAVDAERVVRDVQALALKYRTEGRDLSIEEITDWAVELDDERLERLHHHADTLQLEQAQARQATATA